MQSFSNFIKGIFIGAGAILPGISSGVICITLGIYEKLLDAILGFFNNLHKNIYFLLPIACGAFVGIFLFSNFILHCMQVIPCQTNSLFIGLLLGSIMVLIQSASTENKKRKYSMSEYFSFLLCFVTGIFLIILEKNIHYTEEFTSNQINILYLILCGFLMSIGIVVPGISSTIILMLLGIYPIYLGALSIVNMHILFPMLLGVCCGSIIFMKIIQKLLKNHYTLTLFGIVGFSVGSIFLLLPHYSFNIQSILGILLLILGFYIGKKLQ